MKEFIKGPKHWHVHIAVPAIAIAVPSSDFLTKYDVNPIKKQYLQTNIRLMHKRRRQITM
jgi:hypothetical protein